MNNITVKREPTLAIQGTVATIVVAQLAAVSMPEWAHTLVALVVIVVGAVFNRSKVTPNKERKVDG